MVSLPTHETRHERYVTLLRERFGPDAASRSPEPDPEQPSPLPWGGVHAFACRRRIHRDNPCTC